MVRNERRRRPVVRTATGLGLVLIVWTLGSGRPLPASKDPLRMGIGYLEAQRYGEAIELFRSIAEKEKDNHEALFYLGKAYFLEERFPSSIEWLEKAVLLQPRNSQYHYWLARANEAQFQKAGLLSKMKYGKRFRDEIRRAVQLDGNNLDARFWLMIFYLTSPRSFGGDVSRGLEQAEAIKKVDLAYGYHAYITAYIRGKRFDLVENELLRRMENFPDRIDYKLDLSWFYLDQKDYPRTIQNSRHVVENHPEAALALFQIGRAAAESGTQMDLGKRCLTQYVGDVTSAYRPHLEWAHFYLGRILASEGDTDLAREEYASALRIVPGFQPAAQALKKLSKRRS